MDATQSGTHHEVTGPLLDAPPLNDGVPAVGKVRPPTPSPDDVVEAPQGGELPKPPAEVVKNAPDSDGCLDDEEKKQAKNNNDHQKKDQQSTQPSGKVFLVTNWLITHAVCNLRLLDHVLS